MGTPRKGQVTLGNISRETIRMRAEKSLRPEQVRMQTLATRKIEPLDGAGRAWAISWELTLISRECILEYLMRPNSTWALAKNRACRYTGEFLLVGLHICSTYFTLLEMSTSTFKSVCVLWGETLLKWFDAISICLSKPHCMWLTCHRIMVSFREGGETVLILHSFF